jgi:uncharacterized membrane protein
MHFTESTLRWLKYAHVLASILFAGNVIVTGVWTAILFPKRTAFDFRFAARAIVITDWIFTFGGAVVLVASGIALALGRGLPIWDTRWIRQALIGLSLSTLIWVLLLIPAQRAMLRLTPDQDAALVRVYRRWNFAGWIAAVPLLWSLWNMTYKPG